MIMHYNTWSRENFSENQKRIEYVGFLALLAYGFLNLLWPSAGKLAQIPAIVLGLVAFLTWGKEHRTSFPVLLLLSALGVQTLSWGLGYFNHPEWMASNPKVDRLGKLFMFIALAWLLGGSTRNTLTLWLSAALGFLLATFVQGHAADWLRGLSGQRVDFDMRNAQHTAMYFGTVLLGLLCFSPRMLRKGPASAWRRFTWLLMTALCLTGLFITQTRAVWLAVCAAMVFMALIWALPQLRRRQNHAGMTLACRGGALALLIAGALWAGGGIITQRLSVESDVIKTVLNGDFADVPYTSVGIRIQTWRAAAEWIAERPITGWGSNGRSLAIKETPWLPEFVRADFGHLHNYFLEVWIAYGVLGLALFAALAIWVGRGSWQAWRAGVLPNDMALFSLAFFLYWVIVNQFESYNSFGSGVFVFNLVLAGLTTHIWQVKRRQQQATLVTS